MSLLHSGPRSLVDRKRAPYDFLCVPTKPLKPDREAREKHVREVLEEQGWDGNADESARRIVDKCSRAPKR